MTPGGTTYEETQLNIESLWSGGPFADPVSKMIFFNLASLLIIRVKLLNQ